MRKTLPLFFLILTFLIPAHATHNMGIKLSYECLGNGDYRIRSTHYVDCQNSFTISQGYSANSLGQSIAIDLDCPGATLIALSQWTTEKITDISRLCPGVVSPCNSIFPTGVGGYAEVTIYRDYNIPNPPCNSGTISSNFAAWNPLVTSMGAYSSNYQSIKLNLTSNGCTNSSPQFLSDPMVFVCNTDTLSMNLSAFDPDGDSLVYRLDTPISMQGSPLPYLPSYSPLAPMGPNWYVKLDSFSGKLSIAGNGAAPEVGLMSVEARSYRNGVFVGSSTVTWVLQGLNCLPDDAPAAQQLKLINGGIQTGLYDLQAFKGIPITFELVFEDDSAKILTIEKEYERQLPGATFSYQGSNPILVKVEWTPDSSFEGKTFISGPTTLDDKCEVTNYTYQPVKITVAPLVFDAVVTNSSCSSNTGSIDLTIQGNQGSYDYFWSNGATTEDLSGLAPGAYTVQITNPFGFYYEETFMVYAGDIQTNLNVVQPTCSLSNGTISVSPTGGSGPYTYLWNTGATTNNLSNLSPGGYSVLITDALGCYRNESVSLNFGDSCGTFVSGRVFFDADSNCVYGLNDLETPNIFIYTSQGHGTFTDNLGNYRLRVDPGNLSIAMSLIHANTACGINVQYLNLVPGQDTSGIDFPWYVTPYRDLVASMSMDSIASPMGRLGGAAARNVGNYPMDGTFRMLLDPRLRASFYRKPPDYINYATNEFRWNFRGLLPRMNFYIAGVIRPKNNVNIGDTLVSIVQVLPDSLDATPGDNIDTIYTLVVGPYDPNDKQVSPAGMGELGLVRLDERDHEYKIRFQNVGNYPAKNVLIRDTLDPNLDITTLNPLFATDDFVASVKPGRVLEFFFEDIYLPDSVSDPIGSIGEINFSIQHVASIPKGSQIRNKAAIYFDFNEPIITNEVLNTLYTQPDVKIMSNPSDVYCEGDELNALLSGEGMEPYTYSWSTGDVDSKVLDLQSNTHLTQSGWYTVRVEDSFGITTIDSVEVNVTVSPEIDLTWSVGQDGLVLNAGNPAISSYQWEFGNGNTSSAAEPRLDVSGLSSLSVRLIASNDCGTDTAETVLTFTGIQRTAVFGKISILPHPVKDISTFKFENPLQEEMSLTILDIRGRKMLNLSRSRGNTFLIHKNALPTGIYTYLLSSDSGKTQYGKIVIE
ncbi:MAG: T9SS type A sorting domain-containing protein [Bacteroidia bacterium]|nr:T9SS type A sorting domain-containing protein [Bacteroidia bacterium]